MNKGLKVVLMMFAFTSFSAFADEVVSMSSGAWFAVDTREVKDTTLNGAVINGGETEITLQSSMDAWGEDGGGESATISWSSANGSGVVAESTVADSVSWIPDLRGGNITLTYTSGSVVKTAVFDVVSKQCAAPVISLADGSTFQHSNQEVTISWNDADGTLYYTLDGSEPTSESTVYTGAFTISETTTIKAKVIGDQYFDSATVSATITRIWGIGDAMNDPDRTFTTDAENGWVRDTEVSKDGVESMRSGAIGSSSAYGSYVETKLSTVVIGKGIVKFWWKASCEKDDEFELDHSEFRIGDTWVKRINGVTDWQEVTYEIKTDGEHELVWAYMKDDSGDAGDNCVWVDMFSWAPATSTTDVPVPYTWLEKYYPGVADYESAAKAKTGKKDAFGHEFNVWEEYVAGTDPTNMTSVFTAKIEMVEGLPNVTWEPDLNENGTKSERVYKIWGKESLDDGLDWEYPTNALHRFFKVSVEMP